jgi:hypothetical protein
MMTRYSPSACWLGVVALMWEGLAIVARVPRIEAAAITNVLFFLALPFTYAAAVAAIVRASASPRRVFQRAVALTLGLVVGLGALEVAAAFRVVHWELVLKSLRGEPASYLPDADLGFRPAPSVRGFGRPRSDVEVAWGLPASRSDWIVATNDRRGYRNATELTQADIVLIGDSHVWGDYVSDDQTTSRVLQARLHRPVANLGVAGYGTAQELVVLKRDALPLRPRVVIWFFFEGNDLYNDQEFENFLLAPRGVRANPWTERHGWWRRSLVRNVLERVRLMLYPLVPTYCPHFGILTAGPYRGQKVLFGPEAAYAWTAFEQHRWERAQQTLTEAMRVAREQGIHLLLVYVPIKFRIYRDFIEFPRHDELRDWTLWPLPNLFAAFCRAEGYTCLDLTEVFRDSVRAGGMPHALADSHWSPEGHQLVAQHLEETIRSFGWIPGSAG